MLRAASRLALCAIAGCATANPRPTTSQTATPRATPAPATAQLEYDTAKEDRELALADEARMQAAEREADALVRARPEPGAQPTRREDVLARLGWELESMRQATGEERRSHAQSARNLLERALERDAEDEGLALMLAELLLTDLADAKPAREIVQRFSARPGAKARWASLRRQVAALSSAAGLADLLVADHLVERRKALAAATQIVARLSQGAAYEEAEHSVLDAAPGR